MATGLIFALLLTVCCIPGGIAYVVSDWRERHKKSRLEGRRKESGMNEQQIKEKLEKQLELLLERSQKAEDGQLLSLTQAIISTVSLLEEFPYR